MSDASASSAVGRRLRFASALLQGNAKACAASWAVGALASQLLLSATAPSAEDLDTGRLAGLGLIVAALRLWGFAAVVLAVAGSTRAAPLPPKELLRAASRRLPTLLAVTMLVAGASGLMAALLVLPGLYILSRFCLAPALACDGASLPASLHRSWAATTGRLAETLLLLLGAGAPMLAALLVAGRLGSSFLPGLVGETLVWAAGAWFAGVTAVAALELAR